MSSIISKNPQFTTPIKKEILLDNEISVFSTYFSHIYFAYEIHKGWICHTASELHPSWQSISALINVKGFISHRSDTVILYEFVHTTNYRHRCVFKNIWCNHIEITLQ